MRFNFQGSAIDILSEAFWNLPQGPCKCWTRLGGGKGRHIALQGQDTGQRVPELALTLRMANRVPFGTPMSLDLGGPLISAFTS